MYTKFNETGRSMVEILGVLAVIGVLSVGGIMGYKYGMMKYRVNETINELNIMANTYGVQVQQMAEEQTLPTDGELLSEENAVTRMGYGYEVLGYDNHFEIALFNVPNPECEQLQKTGWELPYEIKAETVTAESCGELVYYIDNGLTGTLTEYIDSDEEDTDDEDVPEKDPLLCNQAGIEGYSDCVCKEGYIGEYCDQCDTSKGYRRMDSTGKCYLDCEKTETCTNEDFCNGKASAVYYNGRAYCEYCQMGYWGTHCENYDPSGDACNGRTDYIHAWHNKPFANGCNCKKGYWGKFCEYEDTEETPLCSGHGTLEYGTCVCETGYSGEACEIEEDGNCGIAIDGSYWSGRSGYLIYEDGKAICRCEKGYTGENCTIPPDNSVCQNGQWNYSLGDTPFCECTGGYTGSTCSTPPSYTCHGTWTNVDNNTPKCSCSYGDCGPTCSGTGSGTYDSNHINHCTRCEYGYTGTDCTIPPTEKCRYSYYWYHPTNGEPYCQCGYNSCGDGCMGTGTNKRENGVNICTECASGYCGPNCEGRGTNVIVNGVRTCSECSSGRCGTNCQGYGEGGSVCTTCQSNYVGENCDKYCSNGTWKVVDGVAKCQCYSGYSGENCSCRGTLTDGKCVCPKNYIGSSCSTYCNPNNGTWSLQNGEAVCTCKEGYGGSGCSDVLPQNDNE